MKGTPSGVHDRDRRLDPSSQRRGIDNGRDFGGGIGREVQLMVDQRGGDRGGRKAEKSGVGASAEGDDLLLDGG